MLSHHEAQLYHCSKFKSRVAGMDFCQDQQTQHKEESYFCIIHRQIPVIYIPVRCIQCLANVLISLELDFFSFLFF